MKKWGIGITVILGMTAVLLITGLVGVRNSGDTGVSIVNGSVDLSDQYMSNEILNEGGLVELNGEWMFYEGKLYNSVEEIKKDGRAEQRVSIPAHWNTYDLGRQGLKAIGSGTFRLTLTLPDAKNIEPNAEDIKFNAKEIQKAEDIYGLKLSGIIMASKVIIDGQTVGGSGVTGYGKEDYTARQVPYNVYFTSDKETVDILIQVSNYHYGSYGGITRPVVFGLVETLTVDCFRSVVVEAMVSAIVFGVFVLFLIMYFFGKREKYTLFFAVHSFMLMFYIMTHGERLWYRLLPGTNYESFSRLNYISASLLLLFLTLYIHNILPNTLNEKVVKVLVAYNGLFGLLSGVLPILYLSIIVNFNMLLIVAVGGYMLVKMYTAARNIVEFRAFILISATATLYTVLIEILDLIGIAGLGHVLLLSQLVQVIAHSLMVAAKVRADRRQVERLSVELLQSNQEKDLLMEETVKSLQEKNQYEMAFLQAQIKPHFLYNTLNTIGGLCINDQYEAEKLVVSFATYLRESLDFDNLSDLVSLKKELKLVKTYLDIERVRFNSLEVDMVIDLDDELMEEIQIPPITIQALVENAIKHGVRNRVGSGLVTIRIHKSDGNIQVVVEDDGVGIEEKVLKHLFEKPGQGDSVGIYNVNQRLEKFYGSGLIYESEVGKGTKVRFFVPLED